MPIFLGKSVLFRFVHCLYTLHRYTIDYYCRDGRTVAILRELGLHILRGLTGLVEPLAKKQKIPTTEYILCHKTLMNHGSICISISAYGCLYDFMFFVLMVGEKKEIKVRK